MMLRGEPENRTIYSSIVACSFTELIRKINDFISCCHEEMDNRSVETRSFLMLDKGQDHLATDNLHTLKEGEDNS